MVTRPDAGSLGVGPRHDGAVQIGGYNVDLAEVRAHLEAHPKIAAARVTAVPTDNDGALRLEAVVTPTPTAEQAGIALADWPAEVATWLNGRVDPRAQPTAVYLAPPETSRATGIRGRPEGAS
jgi:acyl-coenzyme A synthetase/AMP-(fatty) acid ligase